MKTPSQFSKMIISIERDNKFQFTISSFLIVFSIYINLSFIHSLAIGIIATFAFLLINGTFLGHAFFEHKAPFLRLMLGNLLLITLLGIVALAVMIIYNLDIIRSAIALTTLTVLSSFSNNLQTKREEHKKIKCMKEESAETPSSEQRHKHLLILELLYSFLSVLLFYLLISSRSGEVYTIGEVMDPLFFPVFCIATFMLLAIIFSSEKTHYKLLLVIVHSILSHIFFVVVFPAGNLGPQQWILGRTRFVFDNIALHGNWWPTENVLLQIYRWGRGDNFQAALSVIFARMFGVDVYWVHLPLVPLLWGIFIPIIAFRLSKTLGLTKNISVLCSLLVLLFPTSIIWGYTSIPNGLGYLFFFCFMYFLLKYLQSSKATDLILVVIFLVTSTLSHYLAGTIALSLLILAYSVKTYIKEKERSPLSAKFALLVAFIFCTSILPLALAYRSLFYPPANTFFSLDRFRVTPLTEMVVPLLLGSYFDLISRDAIITTLIFGIAPLLGLIGMFYVLRLKTKEMSGGAIYPYVLFLFLAFLLVVADDRIVKFFMIRVPFVEIDRFWVFRDLIVTPFAAVLIAKGITFAEKIFSKHLLSMFSRSKRTINFGSSLFYLLVFILLSGWVTTSVYYAYPHYAPLQTTVYEIEAAKYIDGTTSEKYIVVADQWMIFAGEMFVGLNNPRAFYFSHVDPHGIRLFIGMKNNPSNETLNEAMETNNATVAYFIIEKPRLGTEVYNRIKSQAQQNDLTTYQVFYYKDEEKLRIFHYKNNTST